MKMRRNAEGGEFWGARASRVLVSASRRNRLSLCDVPLVNNAPRKVRDREDAFASTRDARAPRSPET
jgi:hypothetical protein